MILLRDFMGGFLSAVLLASSFSGCSQAPADMPYPTPRSTGFSSTCTSGEPIGNMCPEFLPQKHPPVYQSNPALGPHRGSGRLFEKLAELTEEG